MSPALHTVSVSATLTVPHLISVYKEPKVRRAFTLTKVVSDRLDWLMSNQHLWNEEYKLGIPYENASSFISSRIYYEFEAAINAPEVSKEQRSQILQRIGD